MEVGQVVFSKNGRDKGKIFIVVSLEGEYVFLADGQLRPLNKPKKKKARHTQPTRTIIHELATTASTGKKSAHLEKVAFCETNGAKIGGLTDADIRKWLLPFKKGEKNEEVSNCLRTT